MKPGLGIYPVHGLPPIESGSDLAALIAAAAELRDGDVVVVTSKIVSKAEGRLVEVDPLDRERERDRVMRSETKRVVARRGALVIAETATGLVCANAGVDGSNLPQDRLALLPVDPDGSASRLRDALASLAGAAVAVVITDTFGRPWRTGQVNVAIGVSGIAPLRDHRGEKDAYGNVLEATLIAEADEIASAAELVMGKTDEVPVAVVRGLSARGDGSARELVRPPDEDLFRSGSVESVELRRTIRSFSQIPVPEAAIVRAVEAAATAPAPHHSAPWRFVWLRSEDSRASFLDTLAQAWRADLLRDGTAQEVVESRLARSDAILRPAPVLLAVFVSVENADAYPDDRRAIAERDMFVASAGAAIQNLMVALSAQSIGSAWISSSLFCPSDAAAALGLPATEWLAMGCVAAGYPAFEPPPRQTDGAARFLDVR